MELNQNTEIEKVLCRREARPVPRQDCRKCHEWLADDVYGLFNRCRVEKERFEALYKLYKRKGK